MPEVKPGQVRVDRGLIEEILSAESSLRYAAPEMLMEKAVLLASKTAKLRDALAKDVESEEA